jgi:hypothetical protein
MRFLPFCYDQQQPDKDLTEEVRGLFPRVAQKIEISVLGAQVVRGESRWTGGLGRESACVSDERHQRREKGRVPGRSDGRVSGWGIVTETRRCAHCSESSASRPRRSSPTSPAPMVLAIRELGVSARHEQSHCQNSRAENSHQPKRRRECQMQRTRFGAAQRLRCRFSQYFLPRSPRHPQTPFAREPNAT